MQGSMGFASAIALGISRQRSDVPVFVLDGDGALIMRLGSLATIGALSPKRFVHLVVDNGTYASTGKQLSVSPSVDFAAAALACGYARAARCRGGDGLVAALDWAADGIGDGPALLHIAVDEREASDLDRPKHTPPEIAQAFRSGLAAR
jgi:phosphonopyruvate decarboxylase